MKEKIFGLLPCIAVFTIDFYLLPLLVKNTGAAMLFLLLVMPLIAFVAALVYGIRNGFSFLPTLLAFILFIPAVFIYFNSSAWIYSVIYAIIVLSGTGFGKVFYGKK